ncbi:hypothetical protein VNO77_02903 [Canavalia gladiata]|uniref:Uncharacterized protein n=1 Tax=Canavalia gladiata TaxID=3824 RepID=A0AAN9MUK7_CANGL
MSPFSCGVGCGDECRGHHQQCCYHQPMEKDSPCTSSSRSPRGSHPLATLVNIAWAMTRHVHVHMGRMEHRSHDPEMAQVVELVVGKPLTSASSPINDIFISHQLFQVNLLLLLILR